jgi:hypothetical protein
MNRILLPCKLLSNRLLYQRIKKMRTRLFKDSDYEMVQKWWVASGCPPVNLSQLQTIGLIGYTDDDEPACAIWAYRSEGVGVAFLEHLITSPNITTQMTKMRVLRHTVDQMITTLKDDGYSMIRACTWSPTFAKVCQRDWGFELIGDNYNNLSVIV